jgi:ubiquinone/menaquinone biosynthesis C-methylase UbiE
LAEIPYHPGMAGRRRGSVYVHGTSRREQARLGMMNALINDGALRLMGIRPGERILDFGSGLGQLTRAFARAAGRTGRVVGIERSPDQLRTARRRLRAEDAGAHRAAARAPIEFRLGDGLDPPLLPDEWGTFDTAHTRFLLEHLPRPVDLVRVMVRAVRPGGRVVLQDEDHDILRLFPEPEGVMEVWRAYIRSYEHAGNDPSVGRRLVALLHEAGAIPRRCDWIFFGGCAGEERFPLLVENLARILEGAAETIAATGLVSARQVRAAVARFRAWARRPDAALWFAVGWVEGVKLGQP